jgi:hypothetical protein
MTVTERLAYCLLGFDDVKSVRSVPIFQSNILLPSLKVDSGNSFYLNVVTLLQDFTTSHLRRQQYSHFPYFLKIVASPVRPSLIQKNVPLIEILRF